MLTRGEEPNIERWTGDLNGYLAATVDGLEEDSAAGVPEKNLFDITVVRGVSLAAGQYKLKIHYIPVDVYLDDIKVFKEGSAEAAEFTNGEFSKTVQKYFVSIDDDTAIYDIKTLAAETKKAFDEYIAAKGLDPKDYPTKVKIGDAEPLGNGIEQLEKGDGTLSEAKATVKGEFVKVPVYVMVPNFSRKYEIIFHRLNDDAMLSDLGVTDRQIVPEFDPNEKEYSVDVEADVDEAEIFAKARHNHDGATTIVSFYGIDGKTGEAFLIATARVDFRRKLYDAIRCQSWDLWSCLWELKNAGVYPDWR